MTIQCSDPIPPAANVTATDNCDPTPIVSFSQTTSPGTCPQASFVVRTWTSVDHCGNPGQSCVQVIQIIDNTAPVISACAPDQTVTAECSVPEPVPDMTGSVSATDNCDPTLTITQSPAAGTPLPVGTHIITFTVKDDCGNSAQCTSTFTVDARFCQADLFPQGSGDGDVGPGDLGQLLSQWGPCPGCCEDLFPVNAPDGVVGPGDLAQLLSQWGPCTPLAGEAVAHAMIFNGNWSDPGSWAGGQMPDASSDVTIAGAATIDQPGAFAHHITIGDGGSLSMFGGTLNVEQITVQNGSSLVLNDPAAVLNVGMLIIHDGASLVWKAGTIPGVIDNGGLVELGDPIAQLVLHGNFSQTATGVLAMDVHDLAEDQLEISGAATIDGTLALRLLDGAILPLGMTADLIRAATVSGQFAEVLSPLLDSAQMQETYQLDAVGLEVQSAIPDAVTPGDIDADGIVGSADLANLLALWGQCINCSADVTGDGDVGPPDLSTLLANWTH
jgi:hypothetical protein